MEQIKTKGCLKGCGFISIVFVVLFFGSAIIFALIPESAESLFEEADRSYSEKNYANAIEAIDKAIKRDSLNPEYYFLKAKVSYRMNDTLAYSNAIAKSQLVVEFLPLKFSLIKRIVDWNLKNNDKEEAIKHMKGSLSIYKRNELQNFSETYFFVSDKMREMSKPRASVKVLTTLIDSIRPFKEGIEEYKNVYHKVSNRFISINDTIGAIRVLKQLAEQIPNSTLAYEKIGDYYSKRKYLKRGINYYKRAVKFGTVNTKVYNKIAKNYLKLRNKKAAIKYYRIATKKGNSLACNELRELTARTKYTTISRCRDGSTSYSTGRGTCSHHGGVSHLEYIPYKEYTMECR